MQLAVPVQAPLQPEKMEPPLGRTVSVTTVPPLKEAAQAAPQEIPFGLLVTVPVPVPSLLTLSVNVWVAKLAVTAFGPSTVTTQFPIPEQTPLHPAKIEKAAGMA